MRPYIPPKERRAFRFSVSFTGVVTSVLIFFSLVSLINFAQSGFIKPPKALANEVKPVQEQISDSVIAVQASERLLREESFQQASVIVNNLPLERSWPIRGRITTYFSLSHPAIDIANSRGTPIHAFASGVVVEVRSAGSWGRYIIIRHNDGFESAYAHLDTSLVSLGQQVSPATIIGTVGTTGRSTGPHLHFQITKNGRAINPLSTLP